MKDRMLLNIVLLSAFLSAIGCDAGQSSPETVSADRGVLPGAWRSKVVFRTGPLAGMKDLEFLYAYNAGGTMTESSNYDEAENSSPPAYGVWKETSPQTFQTKYLFYTTKRPDSADGTASTDWWPAGHGVLTETIELSPDGKTYSSVIKLSTYDQTGALIPGEAEGTGSGTRIAF